MSKHGSVYYVKACKELPKTCNELYPYSFQFSYRILYKPIGLSSVWGTCKIVGLVCENLKMPSNVPIGDSAAASGANRSLS